MKVDITPTWEGLLPVLVRVATQGQTAAAQKHAWDELTRMAKACDEMNAAQKESDDD